MHPKTLLIRLWLVFSTVGTVISLASLLEDIVAWVAFIQRIVEAYRDIVDAIWEPLFALLPFQMPRWTHDYFTITSLMSVSVLWALYKTGEMLGPGSSMSTLVDAIRRTALDFTVGGNGFEKIGASCRKELSKYPEGASLEVGGAINQIARTERSSFLVLDGIAAAAFLVVCAIFAPIVIPPFLAYRDDVETRRTYAAMARRKKEALLLTLNEDFCNIIVQQINLAIDHYGPTDAVNKFYHAEIRRQIFYYYAAVAVLFLAVVMSNYAIKEFQKVNWNGST